MKGFTWIMAIFVQWLALQPLLGQGQAQAPVEPLIVGVSPAPDPDPGIQAFIEEEKRLIREAHKDHEVEFDVEPDVGIVYYHIRMPGKPFELVNPGGRPLRKGGVKNSKALVEHVHSDAFRRALELAGLQKRNIEIDGKTTNLVDAIAWMVDNGYWSGGVEIEPGTKDAEFDWGVQPAKDGSLEFKSPVSYVGRPKIKDPTKKRMKVWTINFPFLKIVLPFACGQPYGKEVPLQVTVDCGELQMERLSMTSRKDDQGNQIQVHRFRWFREYEKRERKGKLCWERIEEVEIPIPPPEVREVVREVVKEVPKKCPECPAVFQCPDSSYNLRSNGWSWSPLGIFRKDNIVEFIVSVVPPALASRFASSNSVRVRSQNQSGALSAGLYLVANAINAEVNRVDVFVEGGEVIHSLRKGDDMKWTKGEKQGGHVVWNGKWVNLFVNLPSGREVKCSSLKIPNKINLTPVPIIRRVRVITVEKEKIVEVPVAKCPPGTFEVDGGCKPILTSPGITQRPTP